MFCFQGQIETVHSHNDNESLEWHPDQDVQRCIFFVIPWEAEQIKPPGGEIKIPIDMDNIICTSSNSHKLP